MQRFTVFLIVLGGLLVFGLHGDAQQPGGISYRLAPGSTYAATGTFNCIVKVAANGTVQLESVGTLVSGTSVTIGQPGPTDPDDPDDPDPPPVPGDLAENTEAALDKVTEPDKAKTSEALVAAYEAVVKSVNEGKVTNPNQLAIFVNLTTAGVTIGREGWGDFVKLVDATLKSSKSVAESKASLTVFITELKKL